MPIAAGRLVRNELGKTAVRLDQLETQIASQVYAKTTHNPLFATKTKGWLQPDKLTATCRRFGHCGLLRWLCYRPDHSKAPERDAAAYGVHVCNFEIICGRKAQRRPRHCRTEEGIPLNWKCECPRSCISGATNARDMRHRHVNGCILCSQLIPSTNSIESLFGCSLSPLQTLD
jgi:hypothetical protein